MRRILIIGATSAIAEATARHFARDGDRLFLVGRNNVRLSAVASDLKMRGATQVESEVMDVNDTDRHGALLDQVYSTLGGLDTVLIAHGTLPDQKACEASFSLTLQELQTNCLSTISLLTYIANRFEAQKNGSIAVITSVAGDRGRQSNYVYGTAKAAVNTFLQGLRGRLQKSGVSVTTIKPGFVDTPMTSSFKKGLLWATPEQIGLGIYKSINKRSDTAYLPWFWKLFMFIINTIPERLFKYLKI